MTLSQSDKQERPWLALYPPTMRTEIDASKYASIAELMVDTCAKFDERPAFSNMGHVMSFRDLEVASRQMAAYFQQVLKLQKGDRIVLQMPNLLQYPVALFGALRAGLIVVNTNPLYTAHEMEKAFVDSGAVAIVILENFADKLDAILAKTAIKHVILTEVGDLLPTPKRILTNLAVRYLKKMIPPHNLRAAIRFRDAMAEGAKQKFTAPAIESKDLAFLQYTGGTTGITKAAMLTHRNVIANQFQMLEFMKVALEEGKETAIAALPLYHIFCLTVNCLGLFHYGTHNVLITNPKDIPAFVKTIDQSKPSIMIAVSTLAAALLNNEKFRSLDLRSLKLSVAGGMALKQSVAEEWKRVTKTIMVEGYGLTEASPVVSCNPVNGGEKIGTIGLPLPSTEVRICDDDGNILPHGESGELLLRGPQVMSGYWNQPEETAKVLTSDGWLKTGDIAALADDGFLKIMDRKKDMILVSGFNVYPNEVEDVMMQNPKVLEVAAIGIPDDHSGEVVKLFVVKRDQSLTEAEVKTYAAEFLAAYKRPKQIEFRTELPKSNVGKVLRRELRTASA